MYPVLIIVIAVLSLLGAGIIIFLAFNSLGFFVGAPYAATPSKVVEQIFSLIKVGSKDVVYDLGSGDGRILIAAAKRGARAVGWEINLPLYLWSKRRVRQLALSHRVKIHFGNFWSKDFSSASVVFAFLLPEHMARLEKKLSREVASGTKILTYLAKFPNQKPLEEKEGLTLYQF